ncbi:MAG: hypothetical protein ACLRS8_15980 [Parabacteroides merdae]
MDKNNLGIIKDMAKLFSATICQVCSFTGCVDMDLTQNSRVKERYGQMPRWLNRLLPAYTMD